MKPVLDLNREYSLLFDGGGARGAYQIGAWKALKEDGVKINAVAGTSVGALNGALVCMGDVASAQKAWSQMRFSKVMDVDDEWMEKFFNRELPLTEVVKEVLGKVKEGGIDITPLRKMIHQVVEEDTIRNSEVALYLLTFSVSDFKELDLSLEDIPEGLLEDYLLASAYLLGFKNEKLHGKTYVDGGVINNVPLASLVDRGYKDIIQVRIYGPGREPRVKLPADVTVHDVTPRVSLGSIIEFDQKRSQQNLKIGYYDAKRMLYGLGGQIYYLSIEKDASYFERKMEIIGAKERAEIAFTLKLPITCSDEELYLGMIEAAAKLLHVPKYTIYTLDGFEKIVKDRFLNWEEEEEELPKFVHRLMDILETPVVHLGGRDFLTLKDFSKEEITYLLDLAAELKEKKKQGISTNIFSGKNIALIFEKTSTRTRCSFEVAASDLGMGSTYLDGQGSQIGKKESIKDTARVLSRMFDGIEYRGYGQEIVEELARHSLVPVWNGLTNEFHPTQMLADFLTIREKFGYLKGIRLTYMGDARYNMGNSMMVAASKMGMHVTLCAPENYFPAPALVKECQEFAQESGGSITLTTDVKKGALNADVIATDVWVSMGEPEKVWEERIKTLLPYKVTKEVMSYAKESAIFMHCLPAFHDHETVIGKKIGEKFGLTELEVTDEVFESDQSVVFDEAENRMHTIKAVMMATLMKE